MEGSRSTEEVDHSLTLAGLQFCQTHSTQQAGLSSPLISSPLFPFLSRLFSHRLLFYERHVKHTGRVKRNAVEMLIVFFIKAANVRKRGSRLPRCMGKNALQRHDRLFSQHYAKLSERAGRSAAAIHSVSKSHLIVVS